uniref:Uncharacterized protein n=1 Tax=Oryza punctata TaxID=4537 RepID=A0A1V1H3I3_ORYPU|nr:hypothetical protein [Oryza punctata]
MRVAAAAAAAAFAIAQVGLRAHMLDDVMLVSPEATRACCRLYPAMAALTKAHGATPRQSRRPQLLSTGISTNTSCASRTEWKKMRTRPVAATVNSCSRGLNRGSGHRSTPRCVLRPRAVAVVAAAAARGSKQRELAAGFTRPWRAHQGPWRHSDQARVVVHD